MHESKKARAGIEQAWMLLPVQICMNLLREQVLHLSGLLQPMKGLTLVSIKGLNGEFVLSVCAAGFGFLSQRLHFLILPG